MSCQCVIYFPGTQPVAGPDSTSMLVNLMAYWKMEENGAADRQDSHTGNYDLGNVGSPVAVPGKISNAAKLFGSPSGTDLRSSNANFGLTGTMTMAGWFYFENITASDGSGVIGQYLAGKQNIDFGEAGASATGYMLYLNASSEFTFWQGNGVTTQQVSSIVPTEGIWYFVAGGYNASTGEQFIQVNNGSRVTESGLNPTAASLPFTISGRKGDINQNNLLDNGVIRVDEFGFWFNRALTEEDVAYLYNSGSGRTYPFT